MIHTRNYQINDNPYNKFFFWENKIVNNMPLFEGYYDDKPITKKSKIVYTGILHTEKNILSGSWAAYPNASALIGFIQHVFLPTAAFAWFDDSVNELAIPGDDFNILLAELTQLNSNADLSTITMDFNVLENLWSITNEETQLEQLKAFCNDFNLHWNNYSSKKLFIKVFNDPSEIFSFVKETLQWDFHEFIEEEINMSLEQFNFLCDNVISEPFINKKFIDILNENMGIMF